MTFEARETSEQEGSPIELFTFRVYGTNFRYTNEATDQTIDALVYQAYAIEHDEIHRTDKAERQNITLTVPKDFPILALYDTAPPSDVITLTIATIHRGDDEVAEFWNGRVLNGIRSSTLGSNKGQLYCENVRSSMKRSGLRRLYGRLCPHQLYGTACGIANTSFRIEVTVDAVLGIEVHSSVLATFPDGRFAGGYIEFEPTPGRIERRGIKSHAGDTLLITHPIDNFDALSTMFVYLGCKHTLEDCEATFANSINYGGWPFIPRLSPMGQSSVF